MEVKFSSGMLIDDARGEMAVRRCFRALERHVGDSAFDQIKAVGAQPSARSRQLENPKLRAGSASSLRSLPDHLIKNTVFLALFGGHDVIPLGILFAGELRRTSAQLVQDAVAMEAKTKATIAQAGYQSIQLITLASALRSPDLGEAA